MAVVEARAEDPSASLSLLRPQNRWNRQSEKKQPAVEAPASPRSHSAILAIEALLPEHPRDVVRRVVSDCGGDADVALEKLLAGAGTTAAAAAVSAPTVDARPVLEARVSASASSSAQPDVVSMQAACTPTENAKLMSEAQVSPLALSSAQTSTDVGSVQAETSQAESKFSPLPDAPSWLPLLQSGGKDTTTPELTHYDRQTELLKAALGARPAKAADGPSMRDMHGAGKGAGKKGGS